MKIHLKNPYKHLSLLPRVFNYFFTKAITYSHNWKTSVISNNNPQLRPVFDWYFHITKHFLNAWASYGNGDKRQKIHIGDANNLHLVALIFKNYFILIKNSTLWKPDKDATRKENYMPISLTNTDAKFSIKYWQTEFSNTLNDYIT